MKRWPGEITAGRVRHAYWTNSSIHDRTRRPQAYSHRSRGFEIDSTADVIRGQRTAAYAQGYGVPGRSEREQGDVRTTSNFKRAVKLDWLNQSSLHKYTSNPAGNRDW